MEITINLNEKQEMFLKEFASKHYSGAEGNRMTADCLHVVENKRERYIPYHEDLWDYYCDKDMRFSRDSDHEIWFDNEIDLVNDYLDNYIEDEVKVTSYEDAYLNTIIGVDGEEHIICNYSDYFEAYGIEYSAIAWIEDYYEPVAYFFILDEAKRYIQYQRHNLKNPRVYTHSAGYSNYGDFVPFRNLLLKMGEQLIRESEIL